MKGGYLIKVIPAEGYSVYRFNVTRRHIAVLAIALVAALLGAVGYHTYEIHAAQSQLHDLQTLTSVQRAKLSTIDAQADAIATRLRTLERQNHEIRRLLGADRGRRETRRSSDQSMLAPRASSFGDVASRLRALEHASAQTDADERRLQRTAMRVLNLRHLAQLARAQIIAAIPSINPVGQGAAIASAYGYRIDPSPEFHRGVDLAADYGTMVRASAAGTVASAGWDDGGFGNKVDIDHGNGYHTWYAHLSKIDVTAGQRVVKGEPIAEVGATGEATGPHLHYQVMHDGEAIDPEPFLNGAPAPVIASLSR